MQVDLKKQVNDFFDLKDAEILQNLKQEMQRIENKYKISSPLITSLYFFEHFVEVVKIKKENYGKLAVMP